MKKRIQPKGLIEYGIELFGWGLMVVHLYRTIAFKVIPGISLAQSNWVFWVVWIVCVLLALVLTPVSSRSSTTVFASINAPVAIYLVISYFKLYKTALTAALTAIGVLLILYICLVLGMNIKDISQGKFRGKFKCFWVAFSTEVE